jgi:Predicted membrane protein (DUF2079)
VRRTWPWVVVWVLSAGLGAYNAREAIHRYREFRSGWSWDLAYYNQWCWAFTKGDGRISVRPAASYADEGPSVWRMNYLSPVRFLLLPIYTLRPDPTTILVVHSLIFWLCVPAAFGLARSECRSDLLALSTIPLILATPLLWPLAQDDFRELQLAIPFVIWSIQGVRARRVGLSAFGIGGMLACRQEFALVVAMLGLVPAREPEDVGRGYRWAWVTLFLGLAWMLWVFFAYLLASGHSYGPGLYLQEIQGGGAYLTATARTATEFLAIGLGSWAILACFAPRVALLAVPWLWSLAHGKWALGFIATTQWHHVRYTAPLVALVLSAGLIGYANAARWILAKHRGALGFVVIWVCALIGLLAPKATLDRWWAQAPTAIALSEARELWTWIDRVGPDDGVVAAYEVTAPLSNRRQLFSYVLERNEPKGFPDQLDASIRWLFIERSRFLPKAFEPQGFRHVYQGSFLSILTR